MDASLSQQNMDEDKHLADSFSSSSHCSSNSIASSLSDFTQDASSSTSSSTSSSSSPGQLAICPLHQMSSLMEQLPPFKRGLSKYFQGKSQSFASLSNVRYLKDLARPENHYRKKIKSSKSNRGALDIQRSYTQKASSKTISWKGSRSSWGTVLSKETKSPILPHRTSSFSDQTPFVRL